MSHSIFPPGIFSHNIIRKCIFSITYSYSDIRNKVGGKELYWKTERHVRCRCFLSPRGKLHMRILCFLIFESIPFHVQYLLYNKEAIVVHVIVALRQDLKGPIEKKRKSCECKLEMASRNWKGPAHDLLMWPAKGPRDMPASGVVTLGSLASTEDAVAHSVSSLIPHPLLEPSR